MSMPNTEEAFINYPVAGLSDIRYFSDNTPMDPQVQAQATDVRRSKGVSEVAILAAEGEHPPSSVVLTKNRLLPGAVGLDIGCGLSLLLLDLPASSVSEASIDAFFHFLAPRIVPSEGPIRFGKGDLQGIIRNGASWLYRAGFLPEDDMSRLEWTTHATDLTWDDSPAGAKRGAVQVGTLGGGGHFLALGTVKNLDPLAKRFGLLDGMTFILVHSGSRGFGKGIAEHHLASMGENAHLASAEATSTEGHAYRRGHSAAANYAIVNRLLMIYQAKEAARRLWNCRSWLIGDHAHNLLSAEVIHGEAFMVHRKGAARAYPAGHQLLHETIWEDVGQIVFPDALDQPIRVANPAIEESFFSLSSFGPRALSTSIAALEPRRLLRGEG